MTAESCLSSQRALFLPYYLALFSFTASSRSAVDILKQVGRFAPTGDTGAFSHLSTALTNHFLKFSEGLQAYMSHPMPVCQASSSSCPVVWSNVVARVRDCGPPLTTWREGNTLLIIPPLTLPYAFFDLTPSHSFISFLKNYGFHPLFFEWRVPANHEIKGWDYYVQSFREAYNQLCQSVPLGAIISFYGGSSIVQDALYDSQHISPSAWVRVGHSGLIPVDLQLSAYMREYSPQEATVLPAFFTRFFFSLGQGECIIQKMIAWGQRQNKEEHSHWADIFVACEDILNGIAPLPLFWAQKHLDNFIDNEKGHGLPPSPRPTLTIQSSRCPSSSRSADGHGTQTLSVDLSAFGLLASPSATQRVWAPMVSWLNSTLSISELQNKFG